MEQLNHDVELRAQGRIIKGDLMVYGETAAINERFEPGSIRPAESVSLNIEHRFMESLAWYPGGGLSFEDTPEAFRIRADAAPVPAGDVALRYIRSGIARGLSLEFIPVRERRDGEVRVIEEAMLMGAAITRKPEYEQTSVETRRRSGFRLRALIPGNRKVACRCSGASCKFARMASEGLQEALTRLSARREKRSSPPMVPIQSRSPAVAAGRFAAPEIPASRSICL